jgi:thiamine-phosphate pyrophosphorylase
LRSSSRPSAVYTIVGVMDKSGTDLIIPPLYAIVDVPSLRARGVGLRQFANELRAAGVSLLQLRDKLGTPQDILAAAQTLHEVFAGSDCRLIMNDRADLALLARFHGVHVGQGDLSPADVKAIGPELLVGVSTHTDAQVKAAQLSAADYVAIGPVFATGTKADAEAVVGLDGVRRARNLTTKPLVAIGGITRQNFRSVLAEGADSVAVVSGLFADSETVARDFLEAAN